MRQNTKAILWVVVIAFVVTIFAVWGLDLQTGSSVGDPNVVGKVNGVDIPRSRYQFAYQQFVEQMRGQEQSSGLTFAQEEFARNQAWDSIVYAVIIDQQIQKLGIRVADQEIVDYLRTNPPPEIQQHFVDEQGQFDNQAYQAALNNPEIDWTSLEQLARDRILRIKLNEYLAAQVHVSQDEVRRAYESETVEMSLEYVDFPIVGADVGDYQPTDDEIIGHYRDNPEEYTEREACRLTFVRIPLKPSTTDIDDAVLTARGLRDQIAAGDEFGILARKFSEAPTSFVDGNTGFITRDQREAPYFAALDTLQTGELGNVVTTTEGAYILKLIDKRKGEKDRIEYNAQEILISVMLSSATTDSLYTVAGDVASRAKETGLEKVAAARGLQVQTPTPFPRDGIIESIGELRSLSDFAFANEAGAVSGALRDDESLYVAQIVERIPERVTPLAEAREIVTQYVLLKKKRDVAERNASAFYQKAKGTDFRTALETYGRMEGKTATIRVVDNVDALGANSTVAQVGLGVKPGGVSPPVEWRLTLYVVHVLSRAEINDADYQSKIPSIRRRLLDRKAQTYAQSWYQGLQEQADIEDYRSEG